MRLIPMLAGMAALAVVSAQATPNPDEPYWRPLGAALSFNLGDHGCGEGWHQALWRDWQGGWWWGPCVPITR
jgi:hypothetical protein